MKHAYRKRPETVNAEQFWPQNQPWPEGVHEVYNKPTLGSRGQPTGRYVVDIAAGEIPIEPGEWVVIAQSGGVVVMPDQAFRAMYEQCSDDAWVGTR